MYSICFIELQVSLNHLKNECKKNECSVWHYVSQVTYESYDAWKDGN